MPSVTYMNRSAPFWDWVSSLEQEGPNHPFFAQNRNNTASGEREQQEQNEARGAPLFEPWGWGFPGFGGRAFPHRGPPPPPDPPHGNDHTNEKDSEQSPDNNDDGNGEGPSRSGSDQEGHHHGPEHRGHCGSRRGRHCGGPWGRGGFGSRFGPSHHGGPDHGGHHHGPSRHGGWGHRGGREPWGRGPFNPLASLAALFDPEQANKANENENEDFSPDADIFDTPTSYVIHVSLPGARKEDVGVNWDAEKSELSIAGVIYRPADEDLLNTLAMGERKVGAFERKVRLGTRATPANVDVDEIAAKLEDGVLRVDVPKLGDSGFVEIRKVDIE